MGAGGLAPRRTSSRSLPREAAISRALRPARLRRSGSRKPSSPPPATGTSNRCRTSSRAAPRFSFRRTPADARHRGPAGPAAPSLHAQRPGHRNTAARFTASASTWSSRCSPTRVQPASGSIPTPRQSRRTDRMAAHHGDPQPVEALAAHHRAAVRLRERARRPPPPRAAAQQEPASVSAETPWTFRDSLTRSRSGKEALAHDAAACLASKAVKRVVSYWCCVQRT